MDNKVFLELMEARLSEALAVTKALRDILYEMVWTADNNHVPNLTDVILRNLVEMDDLLLEKSGIVREEAKEKK